MALRIAQFVHATHDVVDEAFLREFPDVEAVKANNFETLSDALAAAMRSLPVTLGSLLMRRS